MELWGEIFKNILSECIQKAIDDSKIDINRLVEQKCYIALKEIKNVLEDDDLEDNECFMKIEEIVKIFESIGSNGGNRHDFG